MPNPTAPNVTPFIPVTPIIEEAGEQTPQPAPEIQPAPAATEPASPDAQPPANATPQEVLNWQWRNERRQVPIGLVDSLAQALGAPSREAVITWTQQGRDHEYHSRKLQEDRERLAQEQRDLAAQRDQLERLAQDLDQRQYPGAPGYGVPTQPQYPQGGYPAPIGPYANPAGYGVPGGYPPVVPPWAYPQDPQAREQMLFQALLSIPHQVRAATEPFMNELRAERQNQTRAAIDARTREEESQLTSLADSYVEKLKNEGWQVGDLTGEQLIEDCNRSGLSSNPQIPWTEALETAAARRFWRHGFQMGKGALVSELETNREATFHVPPAKPAAAPPAPQLQSRIQAARTLGENISMREALE